MFSFTIAFLYGFSGTIISAIYYDTGLYKEFQLCAAKVGSMTDMYLCFFFGFVFIYYIVSLIIVIIYQKQNKERITNVTISRPIIWLLFLNIIVIILVWGLQTFPSFYQFITSIGLIPVSEGNLFLIIISYLMSLNGVMTSVIRLTYLKSNGVISKEPSSSS